MDEIWTVETLRLHVQRQLDDLRALLNERYATQTKANEVAFAAAERAVAAALLSAEKAVTKAEMAADKRFDAVNEFRQQLNDIINTFMPRSEAEQRIAQNTEKIEALTGRVNLITGRSTGMATSWGMFVAGSAVLTAIIGVVITILLRR